MMNRRIAIYGGLGGIFALLSIAQDSSTPANGPSPWDLLVAPGLAQADRPRELVVVAPPGLGDYEIHFYAPRPMTDHPPTVRVPHGRTQTIAVPALARSVAIWGSRGWSLAVALPDASPGGRIRLEISVRSNFVRSTLQAFGASSSPYVLAAR